MHEKHTNFRKDTVLRRINDPILRDYLRVSGSPMVTSYRGGTYGVQTTKVSRQKTKRRRVNPMIYIHRVLYVLTIISLSTAVAVVWG